MEAAPENEAQPQPRRQSKHKGHAAHGGAWKVAYADFVTAMLALFIVLWILSQDQPTKEAIQGYFRDPIGFSESMSSGKMTIIPGQQPAPTADVMNELERSLNLEVVRMQNIVRQAASMEGLEEQIDIQITEDGIRIELRDNVKFNFFQSGSAQPTAQLQTLMKLLTPEIDNLGYPLQLEGHTDNKQFGGGSFTNWELSSERAHALRKLMVNYGLRKSPIVGITAYADTKPLNAADRTAPENRRVSILIKTPLNELRERVVKEQPIQIR